MCNPIVSPLTRDWEAPNATSDLSVRGLSYCRMSALPMRSLLATTLLVAAARGQIFSCKDDKVWPSSVDGRQNPPNATGNYVEWWFFTAFSPSEDVV